MEEDPVNKKEEEDVASDMDKTDIALQFTLIMNTLMDRMNDIVLLFMERKNVEMKKVCEKYSISLFMDVLEMNQKECLFLSYDYGVYHIQRYATREIKNDT